MAYEVLIDKRGHIRVIAFGDKNISVCITLEYGSEVEKEQIQTSLLYVFNHPGLMIESDDDLGGALSYNCVVGALYQPQLNARKKLEKLAVEITQAVSKE